MKQFIKKIKETNYIDYIKKEIIPKINIKNFKNYVKTDLLILYFILGAILNSSLLRFFTVKNFFDLKPFVADLAFILAVGGLSYFVKKNRRYTYFLVWSIIMTALCIINSIYYTFYSSFVSASLLSTSVFALKVTDAIAKNVFHPKDVLFLWFPIMLIVTNRKFLKTKYYSKKQNIGNKNIRAVNLFVISAILGGVFYTSLTPLEVGRLSKQWNREFLVAKFGLYIYHINDLVKIVEPKVNTLFGHDKAARIFREFYDAKKDLERPKNKYTNIFEGKNIIGIHAESMQSFLMGLEFNDEEVTPTLNKLAKEGMHFTNYYTQVGVGTSSDTEFTLATSLLPNSNGTVFVSYWDREYVTIPKLLKEKGYYTFSMHGNNGTFWNRIIMHDKMGYDKFYHKSYYDIDDKIGFGLSDVSFFRQVIPIISDIKEKGNTPFYGTIITLSNHTPFSDVDLYGEFPVDTTVTITDPETDEEIEVTRDYMEGTKMGNYIKSAHYADGAMGQFIEALKESGLAEDTVVVIYGDHDARLPRSDFNRLYNYDPETDTILEEEDPNFKKVDYYQYELDRKVPLIIWTADKKYKKEIDTVMGTYDVLPTLGNMFGFYSPYQLGTDIFSTDDNIVVFPNSNWLTNKVYYNAQRAEYKLLKDEPISEDYIQIRNDYADSILEVSNALILYDLIKKEKEQEKINLEIKGQTYE
ncbi:MAG: LTA synthase family protein [Bacilli bacterium]|nr:LTA synthase family protein [Bacilli bacterium]